MNDCKQYETDKEDLARMMRALGHPVRLDIMRILAEKCDPNCCCTDVTECLPLAQSTVSQHIKVLLEAGLIKRHAKGTRNQYSICQERITELNAAYRGYMLSLSAPAEPAISTTSGK